MVSILIYLHLMRRYRLLEVSKWEKWKKKKIIFPTCLIRAVAHLHRWLFSKNMGRSYDHDVTNKRFKCFSQPKYLTEETNSTSCTSRKGTLSFSWFHHKGLSTDERLRLNLYVQVDNTLTNIENVPFNVYLLRVNSFIVILVNPRFGRAFDSACWCRKNGIDEDVWAPGIIYIME